MIINEQLQLTIERFKAFQSAGKYSNYPTSYKLDAVSLMANYSLSLLSQHLAVSIITLRKWKANHEPEKRATTRDTQQFVVLDTHAIQQESVTTSKKALQAIDVAGLTVCLPHGLSLQLPKQSLKQATRFVCALVEEFKA